tara:strand:+ start:555 stop:839 length:285 start_codon:yes stop_codon:yes gene_type:complete
VTKKNWKQGRKHNVPTALDIRAGHSPDALVCFTDVTYRAMGSLSEIILVCQNTYFKHFENEPVAADIGLRQYELLDQAISKLHEAQSLLVKYSR